LSRRNAAETVSGIATFSVRQCLGYTGREYRDDHMTANHRYMSLSSLRRRPVLIAMMMYSVAYGAVTFAVWREANSNSNLAKCEKHSLVQSSGQSIDEGATLHFLI
jgi:hypothetical protein